MVWAFKAGRNLIKKVAKPITKPFRQAGRAVDKKLISGDWEAARDERNRMAAATSESQKNIAGEIAKQERMGQDYFGGEGRRIQSQWVQDQDYLNRAFLNTQQNINRVGEYEGAYQRDLGQAKNISNENMSNARTAYQTLSPYYRDAMESAQDEAKGAMTLQDYMDPNNQVAQGVRNLYNTEGQGAFERYDTQAQNLQREGQANFGVLSALGAQSAAQAMGDVGPQTVGAQMAQMAMANRQAAEAYAGTQRRMQQLRDMGMSTREALRQTGLERGFDRSDAAYEAGRLAKEDAMRRMGDFEGFEDRNINRMRGISDRLVGLSGEERASRARVEDTRFGGTGLVDTLRHGLAGQHLARQSDLEKARLGFGTGLSGMRMGREDINLDTLLGQIQAGRADRVAQEQALRGMVGGVLSAGGQIAGAVFGGPAGAAAMGQMTGQATQALNQPTSGTLPQASAGYQSFAPQSRYGLGVNYGTVNPYPYGVTG